MQIVINIPDKEYEEIIDNKLNKSWDMTHYERVIAKGKPLPKGHGRLKDVDHYRKMQWEHPDYSLMDDEPTIIEADVNKSQESEKINCKSIKCENCINRNYCDFEPQKSEE